MSTPLSYKHCFLISLRASHTLLKTISRSSIEENINPSQLSSFVRAETILTCSCNKLLEFVCKRARRCCMHTCIHGRISVYQYITNVLKAHIHSKLAGAICLQPHGGRGLPPPMKLYRMMCSPTEMEVALDGTKQIIRKRPRPPKAKDMT